MEKIPTQEFDAGFDLGASPASDEDRMVRAWREEQLRELGLPAVVARAFADDVDWHDIASLVRRYALASEQVGGGLEKRGIVVNDQAAERHST